MADPTKPDFEDEEPPLVTPEASLAADDPTAVWDAESLREAGLDVDVEGSSEPVPLPPATQGTGDSLPSIVAQDAAAPPERRSPPPPATAAQPRKEMGWGATLALALGLGGAVYLVVRFLQ